MGSHRPRSCGVSELDLRDRLDCTCVAIEGGVSSRKYSGRKRGIGGDSHSKPLFTRLSLGDVSILYRLIHGGV